MRARIASSSSWICSAAELATFMAPMPCSALIEPPNSFTMSCTVSCTSSHWARNAASSPGLGELKLKCRLPSPRWPKLTGRAPGISASTAGVALAMKVRDRRHRHGNIMLDRGAFALLGFRKCFRAASTAPRPGPGWRPPPHRWPGHRAMAAARPSSKLALRLASLAAGRFHQHIPGRRRGQRIAGAGDMPGDQFQGDARDQFEGRQHAAGACLHLAQQFQRRGGRGHGGEGRHGDFRAWETAARRRR